MSGLESGSDEFIQTSLAKLEASDCLQEIPKFQKLNLAKPIELWRDQVPDRNNGAE